MSQELKNIINNVMNGNTNKAKELIYNELDNKVVDTLNTKRQEMAMTYLGQTEENYDIEEDLENLDEMKFDVSFKDGGFAEVEARSEKEAVTKAARKLHMNVSDLKFSRNMTGGLPKGVTVKKVK